MKVLKFGGTSVGSAETIRSVAQIIGEAANHDDLVVVVSAFSGVTNLLEEIARKSVEENVEEEIKQLNARHRDVVEKLIEAYDERVEAQKKIDGLVYQLAELCRGIGLLGELTPRARARILSAGELMSGAIVSGYLLRLGMDAAFADSRDYFITTGDPVAGEITIETTYKNLESIPGLARIVVMPGFIARDVQGFTTTLGRGGSDYTAALVAGALNAAELQIWTDVSGVMSADPRLVNGAHPIDSLTYEEAMELSYFGAKVIYPPTMQPLVKSGIPLAIRNTMEPAARGTTISHSAHDGVHIVKGISSIPFIALITVTGPGMIGVPGTARRMFDALARKNLNVLFITQSSSEHTITVGLTESDSGMAQAELREEFKWELLHGYIDDISVEGGLALVAAVGEGMKRRPGVAGKLFGLLGDNGVNIRAIAQGSTERNVSFVVKAEDAAKALNVLHEGFFLSPIKVAHVFSIGVGNVGSAMLTQLSAQQALLRNSHKVELRLAGIANSKQLAVNTDGFNPADWEEALKTGQSYQLDTLPKVLADLNLRNAIFVDNTGSAEIASLYGPILSSNIHVVASNKITPSSSQQEFNRIRQLAADRGVKFLYETNVAAGLPVISTIRDLMMTGDRIRRIEAILSGSLNFIFNNLSESVPFSHAVTMARELGLTEPDPGIDLSGLDVKRKILILARESGRQLEMDDITEGKLIPAGIQPGMTWDALLETLQSVDSAVEEERSRVAADDKQWRFIATLDGDKAEVGVVSIDRTHPAWVLEGKDNLVLIYSDRYPEQPLVVKGAGAGPEVTAGGVLADVLRIVNG